MGVIIKMASERAMLKPLALFLKPQSPAERLAAAAATLHRQQQPAVGGSQLDKLISDRTLAKSFQTQYLIPDPHTN